MAAFAATASFAQTAYLPSGANVNPAWGNGVKIVGGFDVGYGNYSYKGSNKVSSIAYNGSSTSQISFLGVEDLGGGTKADFWFESDINPVSYVGNPGVATLNGTFTTTSGIAATGGTSTLSTSTGVVSASTWGNGQVKAGIGGSFGYLAIGAVNNAGLDANGMTQPFGTAYGGGYGIGWSAVGNGTGSSAKVRYDNSARYLTPELAPGLIGSVTYRPKNTQAANNMFSTSVGLQGQSGVQELSAIYRQGAIQAIVVNQIDDAEGVRDITGALQTSAAKYTTNSYGGNYTMGNTTLYAGIQKTVNGSSSINNSSNRFAVKYMVTPMASIAAAYTNLKATDGKNTRTIGVGADYFLSKMTAIYGRYEAVKDDANKLASTEYNGVTATGGAVASAATAGFSSTTIDNTRNRLVIGLRTNF